MKTQPHDLAAKLIGRRRNDKFFDVWSIVHCATGILFGLFLPWQLALGIMILWEPLENLVLSPLLAHFGIDFGYESWKNSLSDIVFDSLGVVIGYALLRTLF